MFIITVHDPVNLGNPEEFTIKELADIVLSMVATDSKLQFVELPSDDPKRRRPDITFAKKISAAGNLKFICQRVLQVR